MRTVQITEKLYTSRAVVPITKITQTIYDIGLCFNMFNILKNADIHRLDFDTPQDTHLGNTSESRDTPCLFGTTPGK